MPIDVRGLLRIVKVNCVTPFCATFVNMHGCTFWFVKPVGPKWHVSDLPTRLASRAAVILTSMSHAAGGAALPLISSVTGMPPVARACWTWVKHAREMPVGFMASYFKLPYLTVVVPVPLLVDCKDLAIRKQELSELDGADETDAEVFKVRLAGRVGAGTGILIVDGALELLSSSV